MGPKLVSCHFLNFGSLASLDIEYNNSLQQFLTSSKGKIYEKKIWGTKFGLKRAKIGPKTRFFAIFSSLVHWFFFEIAYNDSLQQFLTSRIGKIHEKKFCGPKLGPQLGFCHFLKSGS